MKKPIIGVTSHNIFDPRMYAQRITYPQAIEQNGGICVLLPCLPTYLAPKAAKKMDGTMLITVRIVPRPILPMIMPPRIVLMMAWLPTC